jgi:D-tyrosyl-tRNA(Tyr) deacylase
MRAVVQRVSRAAVRVGSETVGAIDLGLVALLGVGQQDGDEDVIYVADKVANLRIFEDEAGAMNRSVLDVGGAVLAVSQFTLYGDCRRGRRPSFTEAMAPEPASAIYEQFVTRLRQTGLSVATGRFRATMDVEMVNCGPVTLLVDSKRSF